MTYATAAIDSDAFKHNLLQVRKAAPKSKVLAMVKADAYGHGFKHLADVLDEADALGVARLEEALRLREYGVKRQIVVMDGVITQEELLAVAKNNFALVIHNAACLQLIQQTNLENKLSVWLKIDTGMHRLGVPPEEVSDFIDELNNTGKLNLPIGLMSHFAQADERQHAYTSQQIQCFNQTVQSFQGPKSLANSAGILAWPESHVDWVRPGIMLYGVSPFAEEVGLDYQLKPVMTLQSPIIAIRQLKKGDAIGYGSTWACPKDMTVGVVAMGYGDGYPRHIAAGTPVLVNQQQTSILGRISMDMLTIDLSEQANAAVGDAVILWGKGLPIEYIARSANTIAYELLCQVTARAKKVKA